MRYIIQTFLIFIFLFILFLKSEKYSNYYQSVKNEYNKLNDYDKNKLLDQLIEINKRNYQNYKKYNDTLKKNNNNFEFGYSELNDLNNETIGVCPLGHFYDGKFEKENLFKNCKKCFKCNKKPGYYTSGGCIGDKDSKCKFGRIPFNIYLESHKYPFYNHNILPIHKHRYYDKKMSKCPSISTDDYMCIDNHKFKYTDGEHNHI